MAIDTDGNLWIAIYGGSAVWNYCCHLVGEFMKLSTHVKIVGYYEGDSCGPKNQ